MCVMFMLNDTGKHIVRISYFSKPGMFWGCSRGLQTAELHWVVCKPAVLDPTPSSTRSSRRPLRKSSAAQSLYSVDMIMYLGRSCVRTSLCLWAYVHACITVCPSWSADSWNTWQKIYIFPEEKETKTPNDTWLLDGACESTFSSVSIPPLQVNPAVNPWALLDPFLSFLRFF